MNYKKTILCLAVSTRNYEAEDGRCVAGKELRGKGYAGWVRPVSARISSEISLRERSYQNHKEARVLDIVTVPFLEPKPADYQTENHLIDEKYYWMHAGQGDWKDAVAALDIVEGPLWLNGYHSGYGKNDKVPGAETEPFAHSLTLVRPDAAAIRVQDERDSAGNPKKKVRIAFGLNGFEYVLSVTDPVVMRAYSRCSFGEYPLREAILCVSLGGLYRGNAYKLVATVITPNMRPPKP